jgi:hypothetical protein
MPLDFADTDDVDAIYRSGFRGVTETRYGRTMRRMRMWWQPTFFDYFPWARTMAVPDVVLAWRPMQALAGPGFCADPSESQQRGDCVGKNIKNCGHMDYAADCYFGETEWKGVLSDEIVYSLRGYCSDGWWTAEAMDKIDGTPAGLLPRAKYTGPSGEEIDLSRYNPGLERNWPGCRAPDWIIHEAAKNPAGFTITASSGQAGLDECAAALAMGFGIGRDGGEGYSSTRNSDGLSERSGGWSHAITVGARIATPTIVNRYNGPIWGYFHNWGRWNSGPKVYEQPDGSWFVRSSELLRNLNSRSVYIVGDVKGYSRRYLLDRAAGLAKLSRE